MLRQESKVYGLLVVGLIAVIGVALTFVSKAAPPSAAFEVEKASVAAPATVLASSDASGGYAVKFTQTSAGSRSIYWGALMSGKPYCNCTSQDAPWIVPTYDTFEQHAGKKASLVHWGQWNPWSEPIATTALNTVSNRGAISFYTTSTQEVSLTDFTNGMYDTGLIRWAQGAKAFGKPFFLRFNWEMNGDWYAWGAQAKANPANFVAAWRHFHDIVRTQGASNVTWVWCPNIEYGGSTPLASLYPGDAYVDWTCIDGYNWGTSTQKPNESWKSFTSVIKPTYDKLMTIAPTKPVVIGETSSSENGGSKPAWITSMLTNEMPNTFPNIKALVWFNWNIFENNVDWPFHIESSQETQAAFRDGIASPYYRSNTFGNLPLLTKVPIP